MELSLKTRNVDGIVIFDMSGKLSSGEPLALLRSTVKQTQDAGAHKFVMNLGGVSYIDSSGLGELINIYTNVRAKGGNVNLLNLTKRIKDLLQMTKLLTVFESFDDEAKAIAKLKA